MITTLENRSEFFLSTGIPSAEEFDDVMSDPEADRDDKLLMMGRLYKGSYYLISSDEPTDYVTASLRRRNFIDALEGKRLDRYISKANNNVMDYVVRAFPELCKNHLPKTQSDASSLVPAIRLIVVDVCVYSYLEYSGLMPRGDNILFEFAKVSPHHIICSPDKYSTFVHDLMDGKVDLIEPTCRAQRAVYKDYLKECALQQPAGKQFKSESIMKYLPETIGDSLRIFKDIVSRVFYEIVIEYNATHDEEHTELAHEREIRKQSNEIQALNTRLKDFEVINARQAAEIENLKAVKESAKPVVIDRSQELLEADARYSVLSEKYENLLVQYNDLKSSGKDCSAPSLSEGDIQVEDPVQPMSVDVDVEAPYLFIVDRNAKFENYIRETFPNAEFTMSDLSIDFNKYTMVIIITSRISHSMYAKFKDRCKDCGANYIHCAHTNTDRIKQLIGEQLAKS